MGLNSKLTWGLAWTGLALVLAVPSLDAVTRMGGDNTAATVLTSDIEPVKPAAPALPAAPRATETAEVATTVTTTRTPNGVIITPAGSTLPKPGTGLTDPVDKLLASGKKLPDYISDGGSKPAETQIAAITPPAATPTLAAPAIKPPTPFPAWARPAPTPVAAPPVAKPAGSQTAALPKAPAVVTPPAAEPTLIVDETSLTGSVRAPAGPVPPAPIVDDSDNWDTESLRQYLERRGILEGSSGGSSASVTERDARESRRQRLDRLLRESGDDDSSFTLF